MRSFSIFILLSILLFQFSCTHPNEANTAAYEPKLPKWSNRAVKTALPDSLVYGKSYLPVYSHIYSRFEHRTFDLTATVSIRNISPIDSLYLLEADYYNTAGDKIRTYLTDPVFVKPLETIEIVIETDDKEGGSGANFLFTWAVPRANNIPLFEAIMISTDYQQGVSFTRTGVQIKE